MAEWQGIVGVTAPKYLKGAEDLTIRGRYQLANLRKRGRIKYNQRGSNVCYWNVMHKQPPMQAYGDAGNIVFTRHDLYTQLNLDWRGYYLTDLCTEKEKLMNTGNYSIVKRYDEVTKNMANAATDQMGQELILDGNASGRENNIHGLESFLADGTVTAADLVAASDDSYAGKNTDIADEGGAWSSNLSTSPNASLATDWPEGRGDSQYDYMTPKLVNWSSTNWGTGSTTWLDNCEYVLRRTTIWLTHGGGQHARPDCYLLSSNMFYDYANFQSSRFRNVIPHKESADLGFPDALNQEGVAVKSDYDIDANVGYGLNFDEMSFSCLYNQMFMSKGPVWSVDYAADKFLILFFGNMRHSPKFFAKLKNYA